MKKNTFKYHFCVTIKWRQITNKKKWNDILLSWTWFYGIMSMGHQNRSKNRDTHTHSYYDYGRNSKTAPNHLTTTTSNFRFFNFFIKNISFLVLLHIFNMPNTNFRERKRRRRRRWKKTRFIYFNNSQVSVSETLFHISHDVCIKFCVSCVWRHLYFILDMKRGKKKY